MAKTLDAFEIEGKKKQLSYLAVDINKGIKCHFDTTFRRCGECPYGPHSNDCEAFFAGDLERFISITQTLITAQPSKEPMPTIMIPKK